MTIFNTVVSVGDTKKSSRIRREHLGRERFDVPALVDGSKVDLSKGKDNTYYVPALFDGNTRVTEKIEASTLIVVDIDASTKAQVNSSLFSIKKDGLEFIIHTTTSHTEKSPRFRLILKPNRNLSEREYRIANRIFCDKYSIHADPNSFKPAQLMFYPLVPIGSEHLYKFVHHPGRTVNVDDLLTGMSIKESTGMEETLPIMMPPGGLSNEIFIGAAMEAYPPNECEFDDWLMMGMALWHQTNGSRLGATSWIMWSRRSEKHGVKITERQMIEEKWPSFDPKGRVGVTMRNILNRTKASGGSVLGTTLAILIGSVETGKELETISYDIKHDPFVKKKDLNVISRAYVKRHNEIEPTELSLGDAKKLFNEVTVSGELGDYFFNNYVFDLVKDEYVSINNKTPVTIKGLNFMYTHLMPVNTSGNRKAPHSVLSAESNNFKKPHIIEGKIYRPGEPDLITKQNGIFLNLFDKSSWPQPSVDRDENDDAIESLIHKHTMLLASGREDLAKLLQQHLGWLRQRPNDRIHFAFSISSRLQGVGKSTFKLLYQAVLGAKNVNTVYSASLSEKYNGFSTSPKLMTFIEEFEFDTLREKNKAIKGMKELITADEVSVRLMSTDVHMSETTTCYAIFSNDAEVIGIEGTGRRWLPIEVNVLTNKEMREYLHVDHKEFFRQYYYMLEMYPDKFCAYFDNISLEGFNPNEVTIVTDEKLSYENKNPVSIIKNALQNAIKNCDDPDITDGVVFLPAVKKYVDRESALSSDQTLEHLSGMKNKSIHSIAIIALQQMGYVVLTGNSERINAKGVFTSVDKPYCRSIMIKRHLLEDMRGQVDGKAIRQLLADIRGTKQFGKVVPINDDIALLDFEKV